MLTQLKVQEVIALLGQGLSVHAVAKATDVSVGSVHNIRHDTQRRRLPVRCGICGCLTTSSPCRACAGRQARRSASLLSPGEADSSPSGERDDRQQTADDSRDEAIAGGAETESINGEETIEDFVSEFTEDVSEVENSEESQAEEASADETSGTESDAATEESPPPSPDQEVTELFEQIKEAQAEKGTPKVISQNTLKKKKRAAAKKKLDEIKQRQRNHFERQFTEYFDYSTKLRGIPAHRILAFDRGEKHKIIQISFKIDEAKVLETVKEICVPQDHVHAEFLTGCLQDAIHRSILPMLYREIRHDMTDYAEKNAVKKFGQNLRYMMLQRPFPNKRVLALDPGGKNGCIAAALDEFGNLIGNETVFIAQSAERRDATTAALAEMVRKYSISAIAIGIGGGSRLTEEAVAHMIETHFADTGLSYIMVNKTGVIAYSTGQIGKEELPNVDSFVRAAVSLGRRLQNPINELVKVEPANLGLGMFLHDIRGKHIKQMLDEIVESCVNLVGVELNSATSAMLTHVAGLNLMTARRICEYRREHGSFRTRDDLRKVPGINEAVYTHAAGFLRITGGDNPLDATNIHPESYELAANILEKLGFAVKDLRNTEKAKAVADKIVSERIGELTVKFSAALNAGLHTVRDILDNFMKPGRDPRNSQPPLTFRKAMMKIENLTPGIELTCTVLNVTEFGAFVDIGLHESGFIHISQMASGYIQSAHDRVFSGDVVRVWVVETDVAKQRVSLSLLPPGTEKQTPGQKPAGGEKERTRAPKEHISRPPRDSRDSRDSKRFDRKPSFDRSPKTFITSPVKKDVKPITEGMKQGKEPMRSFSDLAQLFGRTSPDESEAGKSKK